ncbi:hypothetical protein [Streptomyces sp. 372A]
MEVRASSVADAKAIELVQPGERAPTTHLTFQWATPRRAIIGSMPRFHSM